MPRQKEVKVKSTYCVVISDMTEKYILHEMPYYYFIHGNQHYKDFDKLHDAISHCRSFPESFTRKIYNSDINHIDYRETAEYEIQYSS